MTGRAWKCTWKTSFGIALLAAVVAVAGTMPAMAQGKRQGPEIKRGGLTVAELIARQRAIHEQISALVPANVINERLIVGITQQDRDDIAAPYVPDGTAPLRIGVVKRVAGAIGKPYQADFNRGLIETSPDGSFVWAMEVSSPGAQAIRIHLTGFYLPDSTEMYLLGPNGQADGPYTAEGRNNDGDFWTRSINGDTGQLVIHYTGTTPELDRPQMSFLVSEVGHIRGRPPKVQERNHDDWPCSDNAPCVVDAQCVNVSAVNDAKDAVAKMEWIQGPFINTCSGGLLADTDGGSQIPYFLTANHCFSNSISNLETFFNYTTESCNGACPDSLVTGGTPPPASTVGITVVASASGSDYTLGILDEAPPGGSVFLGWNTTPVANSNGANLYRISNANFGPQVYSQHDVDTGSPTCSGIPRGGWIYSQDQTGATMGGSSGSPVVNSAGEVVGQLTGCCGFNCGDECDSASNWTIDGALAAYFSDVEEFLDPPGGGCSSDAECDDGQFCTGTETCVSGSCQSSGDPCGAGETCNESTDTCDSGGCSSDAECDDGQFCTGTETCVGGSCQSSGDPCGAGETCNESTDTCDGGGQCGGNKAPCSSDTDCCSGNCKRGTCRGN